MKQEIDQIKQGHTEIQKAIKYLVDSCLDENGISKIANPKPVVLHSIRVGMILLNYNYSKEIVIAGILHDVIEDAEISKEKIAEKFGNKIAAIVWVVSHDANIADDQLRTKTLHSNMKEAGKDTVIVSIADHIDNFPYLIYAKDDEEREWVRTKWLKFFDEVALLAKDEPIYEELKEQIEKIR